jgi:hypothetical protein
MVSKPRSWISRAGAYLIPQLIALVFFVGFPVGWTAVAPVTYLKFERHDGRVAANAKVCLLFFIPYRQATIEPVVGFEDRFIGGTVSYDRKRTNHRGTKSEDQSYLTIRGENEVSFEAPVSPSDAESIREQAEAFLKEDQATELAIFTYASWNFSIFGGGLISLLTVIYVGAIGFGLVIKLVHGVQWACGVPPGRRWLARHLKNAGGDPLSR